MNTDAKWNDSRESVNMGEGPVGKDTCGTAAVEYALKITSKIDLLLMTP